jgi:hypothetical protein
MHPYIPVVKPHLTVRLSDKGLSAAIEHEGLTYSFPLPIGHAERALSNAFLHLTSGIHIARIIEHFHLHTNAESSCPCCKLEGRILSGQGRKTVRSEDMFRAARAHHTGKVEIRHIRPGLSGAQLRAYEAAYNTRTTPHPTNVVKSVNKRIEDLI